MVKRIALTLGLVGIFAFAGVAFGASEEWAGRFDKGGRLTFKLMLPEQGEQYKVKRWEWNNFKIRCRNGRHRYDGTFRKLDPRVVDPETHEFEIKAENPYGGKATLRGSFDKDFTRATGTFKIRGRTYAGRRCRGKSGWTAQGPPQPPE